MASTYTSDLDLEKDKAAAAGAATPATAVSPTASAAPAVPAVDSKYATRLQELSGSNLTYAPSSAVSQAQSYLQNIIDNKPGSYQSKYTDQLQGLYDQIMSRKQFTYDLNGDMLYQQYAQQYQTMGKQAMQDTMGQAAMMTGGYGNSYANTAGNQAYQAYLTQLNNIVPELYNAAFNRYTQEGQQLQDQYSLTAQADATDYGRYQDTYNQWADERSYAQGAYDSAYSKDYNDYTNRLNMAQQMLQMEREDAQQAQQTAYSLAMSMIQRGVLPSDDVLNTAGISKADALALAKKFGYGASSGSSGGSGGSSKKSGGSSSKSGNDKSSSSSTYLEVSNAYKAAQPTAAAKADSSAYYSAAKDKAITSTAKVVKPSSTTSVYEQAIKKLTK